MKCNYTLDMEATRFTELTVSLKRGIVLQVIIRISSRNEDGVLMDRYYQCVPDKAEGRYTGGLINRLEMVSQRIASNDEEEEIQLATSPIAEEVIYWHIRCFSIKNFKLITSHKRCYILNID
jgi:hypothetical protein